MKENAMTKSYWLIKSEPDEYGWDDLKSQGEGIWSGVRNAQASNNLKTMRIGDECFFYHSRQGLEIVGICAVSAEHFPDPTDRTGRWVAVKVKPLHKLERTVTLKAIKANETLRELAIIRQSRLSVAPVTQDQWNEIVRMSQA